MIKLFFSKIVFFYLAQMASESRVLPQIITSHYLEVIIYSQFLQLIYNWKLINKKCKKFKKKPNAHWGICSVKTGNENFCENSQSLQVVSYFLKRLHSDAKPTIWLPLQRQSNIVFNKANAKHNVILTITAMLTMQIYVYMPV